MRAQLYRPLDHYIISWIITRHHIADLNMLRFGKVRSHAKETGNL